jgi:hypothetical protein
MRARFDFGALAIAAHLCAPHFGGHDPEAPMYLGPVPAKAHIGGTSEHYRRFAQECLEMERAAKDERARATLIQMVQVWFRLAADQANEADEEKSD